jgi:hypothetical protein
MMNKKMIGCCVASVLAIVGCSAATDGLQGPPGSGGANGSQGLPGSDGQGPKGDMGEVGAQGDAGVSLCGDVQMPEWHKACGADLVGVCATMNARWECHAHIGQGGEVVQFKLCADADTHLGVKVGAAQQAEYPSNCLASGSGRCDTDGDCDGKLDLTSGIVGDGESNQPTVALGDVLTVANATGAAGGTCSTGTVTCVEGSLAVTGLTAATGSENLGADCFDPQTQLEKTFACNSGNGIVSSDSPDNDGDPTDLADLWYLQGAASVVCNGPVPAKP